MRSASCGEATAEATLVGDTLYLYGYAVGLQPLTLSADGSRAYLTTYYEDLDLTGVYIFDTGDGALIAEEDVLGSTGATPLSLSEDGTRIYVSVDVYDPANDTHQTRVTLLDSSDATVVGSPVTIDGKLAYLSDDSGQLSVGTEIIDPATLSTTTTFVTTIDLDTGSLVPPVLEFDPGEGLYVIDESHALLIRVVTDPMTDETSKAYTIVDPENLDLIAEVGSFRNDVGLAIIGDDIAIALQIDPATTALVFIDGVTGEQLGDPIVVKGDATLTELSPSPDGSRLLLVKRTYDPETNAYTTAVTFIDPAADIQSLI